MYAYALYVVRIRALCGSLALVCRFSVCLIELRNPLTHPQIDPRESVSRYVWKLGSWKLAEDAQIRQVCCSQVTRARFSALKSDTASCINYIWSVVALGRWRCSPRSPARSSSLADCRLCLNTRQLRLPARAQAQRYLLQSATHGRRSMMPRVETHGPIAAAIDSRLATASLSRTMEEPM